MRRRVGAIAALCVLVAGCGSGSETQNGFEEGFDKSFHEKFVASCTSSAQSGGVELELATKLCTCASDEVKKRFTVREKMALKNEQVMPIVEACRARIPS